MPRELHSVRCAGTRGSGGLCCGCSLSWGSSTAPLGSGDPRWQSALLCSVTPLSLNLRTNSALGFPTVFDCNRGEENIFWQSLILKRAKFLPQNRRWNFILWSLQKSHSIYLVPCFIFIHICLSCWSHSALCKADLGGMLQQEVLAVLWCPHHHSLLLTTHWGLIAHLVFGVFFFQKQIFNNFKTHP